MLEVSYYVYCTEHRKLNSQLYYYLLKGFMAILFPINSKSLFPFTS